MSVKAFPIERLLESGQRVTETDFLAVEEPLEIRIEGKPIAVVMRTPGHDAELVWGFLLTEGIIRSPQEVFECTSCGNGGNAVDVFLLDPKKFEATALTRHVFSGSSCGICGLASIEAIHKNFPPLQNNWKSSPSIFWNFEEKLRVEQASFAKTGGLHACALFNANGELLVSREDVGRHNAVDKVLGCALRSNQLPLSHHVLMVSGRISFEIAQKALSAGIPIICGISAPSSLAVEFAEASGQTVIGFLRGGRMNVYSHPERILGLQGSE